MTAIGVVVTIAVLVLWKKRVAAGEGWKARAAEEGRSPEEKPPEKGESHRRKKRTSGGNP